MRDCKKKKKKKKRKKKKKKKKRRRRRRRGRRRRRKRRRRRRNEEDEEEEKKKKKKKNKKKKKKKPILAIWRVLLQRFFTPLGMFFFMKTLEDEQYVVIKCYKFTILRDFLYHILCAGADLEMLKGGADSACAGP